MREREGERGEEEEIEIGEAKGGEERGEDREKKIE